MNGVTAAATGAIAGAVIVLGRRSLIDGPAITIALVTLAVLWRWKKAHEPVIVIAAAFVGLLLRSIFP